MEIAEQIAAALTAHPSVTAVRTGTGAAPEFAVEVDDFTAVAGDLATLVREHAPLAAQWDRLGVHEAYIVVLPGPVRAVFHFPGVPRGPARPWRIGPDTLAAVDAHFWDWSLRVIGARRMGNTDRVRGELFELSRHLLVPLGIDMVPSSLAEAADRYLRVRDRLETRYRATVPRRLQKEVLPLVRDGDQSPSALVS